MTRKRLTLTGNDIALAEFGAIHGANWWKQRGRSKYCKAERQKYLDLASKLSAIMDHAYPYIGREEEYSARIETGDEPIVAVDFVVTRETRRIAHTFNRRLK